MSIASASAFEMQRLNGFDNGFDDYTLSHVPLNRGSETRTKRLWCIGLSLLVLVAVTGLTAGIAGLSVSQQLEAELKGLQATLAGQPDFLPLRKLAFGSCTAYDERAQPVWTEGVIPSQPDAWVWLGDFAYLDTAPVSCNTDQTAGLPFCNCTAGWISWPGQCMAGNVDAARERWAHAVHNPDYRAFLDFMCPPQQGSSFTGTTTGPGSGQGPGATLRGSGPLSGAAAAAQRLGGWRGEPGRFPPVGTDPTSCPRPIFGVWDDHDYGWNNGNRRLPNKAEYKRMYLDAVGEAPGSSRRGADAGMQAVYSLSGGGPGLGVDLVLLDERWYRDPLPCELRRDWCTGVLAQPELFPRHTGFCRDFLLDDGASGRGSCCTKDGDLAAWCALPDSRSSPLWASACDPTSAQWGSGTLVLGADNRTLMGAGDALWDTEPGPLWSRLMQAHDSPVCEVLGAAQRRWLRERLASSSAALTLVASGSVPVGNPVFNDSKGLCSDDDWTCYRPAQVNLLHTVANVSSGCVVILTGDFHYGDIKLITPGPGTPYAGTLQTGRLRKPIYQIMASGMTDSTAKHDGAPCAGSFREDLLGLRPLGRCSYMDGPNFGMVEVDWEAQVAHLTLRDASSGAVAVGLDGKEQHLALSLKTCLPV